MADALPLAFVTGWPVEQSLSPLIHRLWLRQHHLVGDYVKHACPPEEFEDFLLSLKDSGYVGGNVTIPHKEMAWRLVQHRDQAAQDLGAVNTVWLQDGVLYGSNTDGYGFLANLDDQAPGWDASEKRARGALVLGAGGAARAIVFSLLQRGFSSVAIVNRTLARAQALALEFGPKCHAVPIDAVQGDLLKVACIVNTTSVGMGDGDTPIDLSPFATDTTVNDIVYKPLTTPLLAQAKQLGMTTVDGLGMLMHQAVPGFERWFGVRPVVTQELRELLLEALGERT